MKRFEFLVEHYDFVTNGSPSTGSKTGPWESGTTLDHCPFACIIPSRLDPADSSLPHDFAIAIVIKFKKTWPVQAKRIEERIIWGHCFFYHPLKSEKSTGVTTDESSHDHADKNKRTEFLKDIKRRSVLSERKDVLINLEATTTATTTPPASATSAHATAPAAAVCLLAGLVLRLGGVIHKQSVEGQAVGEDIITNCRTTDVDGIQRDGVAALGGHLNGSEGGVHLRRDGCDGAVENCAYNEGFVSVRAGSGNSRAVARLRLAAEVPHSEATGRTIFELNSHRLIGAFHQKARWPVN
jgi:hypothetical protein